jgi:hypothetical protein
LSGNKTRKREKKELTLNPIVTPNNLKNKLLNRIKEYKNKEIKASIKPTKPQTSSDNSYTDEFYGALDYLSDLSKKQKTTEAKQRSLNTRTLKNYQSPTISNFVPSISLDLPPELQEPIKSSNFIPQTNEIFNVNYKVSDDVPYGCLKGGKKKTFREWKELSKPDIYDVPDIVRPPTPPKKNVGIFLAGATPIEDQKKMETTNRLSREERLEQIKNKLRQIQDKDTAAKQDALDNFKNLEKAFSAPALKPLEELDDIDSSEPKNIENMIKEREEKIEDKKIKKYLKKTVKRKFTLGKSDKLRKVSVLIKDRQTRKNIINTQKELKKTTLTDIKKYLRQHGIIKIGSTCPADILRKTFEAAVLTGEVTNTNKDTLLHNFMAGVDDEKQEN